MPEAQKYQENWVNGFREVNGKSYNDFINEKDFFESWSLFDGIWQNDERNSIGTLYKKTKYYKKENGKIDF